MMLSAAQNHTQKRHRTDSQDGLQEGTDSCSREAKTPRAGIREFISGLVVS